MGKDPRQNVNPGERLSVAASQINWINSQMRPDTAFRGDPLAAPEHGRNVILAKNSSGTNVPRWGVMEVTGIEIDPSIGEFRRAGFEDMPCVTCGAPGYSRTGKVCIAIDPINDGKIGRVSLAGLIQAKVQFENAAHGFARPEPNTTDKLYSSASGQFEIIWSAATAGTVWALVRFGNNARLRIGKTSLAWNKGTVADIPLWETGTPPNLTATGTTLPGVVNLWTNIAANKWVGMMDGPGAPYLVVAEC